MQAITPEQAKAPLNRLALSNIQFESLLYLPALQLSGKAQMAIDASILKWLETSCSSPTLLVRVYTWTEPTWSLGRFQDSHKLKDLLKTSYPVVNRPTGGRALLHDGDISFLFATNHPELLKLSVKESYCVFQQQLRQTIGALGVPLENHCDAASKSNYHLSTLCMDSRLGTELAGANGEKLCGMAQARNKHALIQHGAAFLAPWQISPEAFETELMCTLNLALETTNETWKTLQAEQFIPNELKECLV